MNLLTMDDEDDTYGFGSFSDLFDGGISSTSNSSSTSHTGLASASAPPTAVARAAGANKQLDVRAMSRLWVSERALVDFEQQRKHSKLSQIDAKEYQHVAAKFDGVTIEGGLGSAFFVQAFGVSETRTSGLLWIQARQSDSNVQEKRKKELQDITNQRYEWLLSLYTALCTNVCLTVVSDHAVVVCCPFAAVAVRMEERANRTKTVPSRRLQCSFAPQRSQKPRRRGYRTRCEGSHSSSRAGTRLRSRSCQVRPILACMTY